MRFASLGSGSRGNALVVEAGATRLLLDCGFGPKEMERRLGRLGLTPGDIDAVFITHEHIDHIGGALACSRRFAWAIHLTHGSCVALGAAETAMLRLIDSHATIEFGDIRVEPYPVPHDAREPVQYVFSDGAYRLGVLTDAGEPTPHIQRMLSGCDALVLECNHDPEMLSRGSYPRALKQRISGRLGHLGNDVAAGLLRSIDVSRLRHAVAAHLSAENNHPDLARGALADALNCTPDWIGVANQTEGTVWLDVS